jgi:UDP-N-acetylglucosamine 2-epimerase
VGHRQDGRQRGVNIIDSQNGEDNVIRGIKKALSNRDFLKNLRGSVNPYGDGKTDGRVARLLSELEINDELLQKKIAY